MRDMRCKQIACISETNAQSFETKMNAILTGISNPSITFDPSKPFTAYVLYSVKKEMPETLLELLELLDGNQHRRCEECPYFERSTDLRRKWHKCNYDDTKTRADSAACEQYYRAKYEGYNLKALEELNNRPYEIE